MLTLDKALQRSVLLGLVAIAGPAAAQGTSPDDAPPTSDPTTPMPAPAPPMPAPTPPVNVDIDVTTPMAPTPMAPAPAPAPTYQSTTYVAPTYTNERRDSTLERYGIGVALGGGVEGFTSGTMRDATNDGGGWNVRLALGTRSMIGAEVAYVGSAQSIDALGLDSSALLVSNGAEANLRFNLTQDSNLQPFAIAGVGWRRYDLTNEDFNTSDVNSNDDVLEVPVGAGLAWKYRGLLFDARGVFTIADQADLIPTNDGQDTAEMHRWGVNANLGYVF